MSSSSPAAVVDAAPWWINASAAAIRRLPFGRYRAAHAMRGLRLGPFLMRLPADAGRQLFVCDLRDAISREVCFTGRYEPQETQLIETLLRPGMTVIDAGAHWGYFTLLCAHRVGPSGRVLSLEPNSRLLGLLRLNVEANTLRQVECLGVAAADSRGTAAFASFREGDDNWGISRLVPAGATADSQVQTIAIDDLVAERRIAKVDLIKIDVEGAELDVLEGMAAGLRSHRYTHVLLECHPAQLAERGASVDECLDALRTAGYRGWSIEHSPAMYRRAAVRSVPVPELLRPIVAGRVSAEAWPHTFWCAPNAASP